MARFIDVQIDFLPFCPDDPRIFQHEVAMDYLARFIDIQRPVDQAWFNTLRNAFCAGVANSLLYDCDLPSEYPWAIARSLWERMTCPRLNYHTPYHVMQMIAFADTHKIQLEPWERLAVWFHDAVYWLGAPDFENEQASADFLDLSVPPYGRSARVQNLLDMAFEAILATGGHHLNHEVTTSAAKVMDLDMAIFHAPREVREQANQCLQREYGLPDIPWQKGRKQFLQQLISKGRVFRHPDFLPFEDRAWANIQEDIHG